MRTTTLALLLTTDISSTLVVDTEMEVIADVGVYSTVRECSLVVYRPTAVPGLEISPHILARKSDILERINMLWFRSTVYDCEHMFHKFKFKFKQTFLVCVYLLESYTN